jgi:filamentous hemagglutinin family protein
MRAKKFLLGFTFCLSMPLAYANPVVDNVAAGKVDIAATASHLQIHQQTPQAIINWQSFNIAPTESVHFQQPLNGIALNRINPNQGASEIAGRLSATGNIILSNAAGIHFGSTAQVDVGGLLATTANISDRNFLANNFQFVDHSGRNGTVSNAGTIRAADHGFVAMLAPHVKDTGKITAHLGQVEHYSTTKFTMKFGNNDLVHFAVDPETVKEAVHSKTLIVDDGKVLVTAKTAKNVLDNIVKRDKAGEANYAYMHKGNLILSSRHDIHPEHMNHDITVGVVHTKPAAAAPAPEERCIAGRVVAAPAAPSVPTSSAASINHTNPAPEYKLAEQQAIPERPSSSLSNHSNSDSEYEMVSSAPAPTIPMPHPVARALASSSQPTASIARPSSPLSPHSDSDSEYEMIGSTVPAISTPHPVARPSSPLSQRSDSDSEYEMVNAPNPDIAVITPEGFINIAPSYYSPSEPSAMLIAPLQRVEIKLEHDDKPTNNNTTQTYVTNAISTSSTLANSDSRTLAAAIFQNESPLQITEEKPITTTVAPEPLLPDIQSEYEMINSTINEEKPLIPAIVQEPPVIANNHTDSDSEYEMVMAPDPAITVTTAEGFINIDPQYRTEPLSPITNPDADYVAVGLPEPRLWETTEEGFINIDPYHTVPAGGQSPIAEENSPPLSPNFDLSSYDFENYHSFSTEQKAELHSRISNSTLQLLLPFPNYHGIQQLPGTPQSEISDDEKPLPVNLTTAHALPSIDPAPTTPLNSSNAQPAIEEHAVIPVLTNATTTPLPSLSPMASTILNISKNIKLPAIAPITANTDAENDPRQQNSNDDIPIALTTIALLLYLLDSNYNLTTIESSRPTTKLFKQNYQYTYDNPEPSLKKPIGLSYHDCHVTLKNTTLHDNYFNCVMEKTSDKLFGESDEDKEA